MICQKCKAEIKDVTDVGDNIEVVIGGVKDRIRLCESCKEKYREIRTGHVREIAQFLLGL